MSVHLPQSTRVHSFFFTPVKRRRRERRRSLLLEMAARGEWAVRAAEEKTGIGKLAMHVLAVAATFALIPFLLISAIGVAVFRRLLRWLMAQFFPDLEMDLSPSVRAASDTMRNQAMVAVLAHFRGACDLDFAKGKILEEVVERRDKDGKQLFPKLKTVLTIKWHMYMWLHKPEAFHIDNHVVLGSRHFRGRPLSEGNIQDYVSDIVSKGMPPNAPPWQVVLIPVSGGANSPSFYALLRLHHLLANENAALRDLLAGDWGWGDRPVVPRAHATASIFNATATSLRSAWQRMRAEKDPVAGNKSLHMPLLDTLAVVLLIIVTDSVYAVLKTEPWINLHQPKVWLHSLRVQADRRDLTLRKFLNLTFQACFPTHLLVVGVRLLFASVRLFLQGPLLLLQLFRDQKSNVFGDFIREALFWMRVAFEAPLVVLKELFANVRKPARAHQSLCGRKLVSWSEPVSYQLVERVALASDSTPAEVLLASAVNALRDYFHRQGLMAPCTSVQPPGASGVFVLPPPLAAQSGLTSLREVKRHVEATRRQPALVIASAWFKKYLTTFMPSPLVTVALNCLTRRYAATIMTCAPEVLRSGQASLWGYRMDNVLLWRPPQANISKCRANIKELMISAGVSLCVVRSGESVRLAMMADQGTWPHQAALPASFLAHLKEMAASLRVQSRNSTPRNSPPPAPATIPALLRLEEESLVD
ncbi:uncharacterized protein LOC135938079 isoform X1 [Cloeon dipterum]|uniref:uncharacterized protein LOC135938079 isoform X1 n=1 Tax=Cloeon dipterum TaxID=197152 RepID=UPI00321FFD58